MTEKNIAFMYYLIQGKPMNLPFMMLRQIKEAAKKSRAYLPYGMVFILYELIIFTEFGVYFDGEDARRLLHTNHYNERSLHQMGYRKVDDRCMHRVSGQEPAANDDATTNDDDDDNNEGDTSHSPLPVILSTLKEPSLVAPSLAKPSVQRVTPPGSPKTPPPASAQPTKRSDIANIICQRIDTLLMF